jgi:perosamine synthetase
MELAQFDVPRNQFLQGRFLRLTGLDSLAGGTDNGKDLLFFMARNAIYYSLKALRIPSGATILVPSYICCAAVQPMLAYGCRVAYYNVLRNCSADLSDLARKIDRADAVLAVHYFGFPQDIAKIRALCDRHRVPLIEDCAHVLQGSYEGQPLGSFGDASVFSWRKQLPVGDGATLRLNRSGQSIDVPWKQAPVLMSLRLIANILQESFMRGRSRGSRGLGNFVRWVTTTLKRALISTKTQSEIMTAEETGSNFNDSLIDMPMTTGSRWIYLHSDFERIIRHRRANYAALARSIRQRGRITLIHPILPEGVCPWILPMYMEDAEALHLKLRAAGIPAVTWGGVRPAGLPKNEFPDAEWLYDNLVFLPVHQSLKQEHLDRMLRVIDRILDPRLPGVRGVDTPVHETRLRVS